MALITAQAVPVTGLAPVYSAVSASDTFVPGGVLLYHVKNAGGSPDTVTLVVPGTLYGVAISDVTVSVPATTGDRMIFVPNELVDPTTGFITVTHSFTTSVTAGLFRL